MSLLALIINYGTIPVTSKPYRPNTPTRFGLTLNFSPLILHLMYDPSISPRIAIVHEVMPTTTVDSELTMERTKLRGG